MDNETKAALELEQYRQMTDTSPVCIKIFDASGKLLFINKWGREEHFLKDTDDISNWSWVATIKDQYKKPVLAAFKRGLAGESSHIEMEHTPEGSKQQWCEGFISPIKDDDGKITRLLFYSTDISAKKSIEKKSESEEKSLDTISGLIVGRELKMVELKEKIKKLESELSKIKSV